KTRPAEHPHARADEMQCPKAAHEFAPDPPQPGQIMTTFLRSLQELFDLARRAAARPAPPRRRPVIVTQAFNSSSPQFDPGGPPYLSTSADGNRTCPIPSPAECS